MIYTRDFVQETPRRVSQQKAAKKNLGFKNLLAEICYFNTPKYKNQFSQEKSTASYMLG